MAKKTNTQEEVMAEQEGPRAAWLPATPSQPWAGLAACPQPGMSLSWGQRDSAAEQKGMWNSYVSVLGFCPDSVGQEQCLNEADTDPLVLVPGDGPAAPGDLQCLLRAAAGQWPAAPSCALWALGGQQCALPMPVHPSLCAQHRALLAAGQRAAGG